MQPDAVKSAASGAVSAHREPVNLFLLVFIVICLRFNPACPDRPRCGGPQHHESPRGWLWSGGPRRGTRRLVRPSPPAAPCLGRQRTSRLAGPRKAVGDPNRAARRSSTRPAPPPTGLPACLQG